MWRLIIWFVIAAALAWGVTWLAGNPGTITIDWLGWHIEDMPVALALALLLVGLLALWIVFRLLRWIIGAPFAITDFFRGRRRRKAQKAIASGVTALLAGNASSARKAASQAARLAPSEPLARLLQGQAALAAGEHKAAQFHFEALKDDPAAEPAALHGLYDIAMRANDLATARAIAERAMQRYPDLPWAAEAMLRFSALAGDWATVRQLLARMRKHKLIDKAEEKRLQATALAAEAQQLEERQREQALQLALQAHKLDPALVPAALTAGRLLAAQGKLRKAARVLEQTWARSPHPDIAEVYAHLRSGDSPRDRLQRVRQLLKKASGGEEGAVALARAAIDAQDWETALGALRPWLNENPSARIFLLMAELEEARSGDIGRMREWLSRARRARPGPAWVAGGFVSPVWLPLTPDGELGAFRWQEPPQSAAAQLAAEPVPEELLRAPEAAEPPAPEDSARLIEAEVRPADEDAGTAEGTAEKAEAEAGEPAQAAAEDTGDRTGNKASDKAGGKAADAGKAEAKAGEAATATTDAKAATPPEPPAATTEKAAPPPPPRGAEAVADLPHEEVKRPPLPDDPGPLPAGKAGKA